MTISNNVVFNTLAKQIGPKAVAAAARSAGISAPLENPNEGIALGNKEVSSLDLASAYATIAAGGVWHQPHLVESVVTADDRVLYQAATEGERRFPERVARNVTEAMLEVAARDGLALPGGRPVAAKTGTVQSRFDGENNDAWMAGFTPSLSTSVWMGTDMNSPIRTARGTPIEGSSLPGEVWQEFMADALEEEPVEQFAPFRPIGEAPSTQAPGDASVEETTPEPTVPPTPDPAVPPGGTAPSGAPPPGPEGAAPPGADPAAPPGGDPAVATPGPAAPGAGAPGRSEPTPAPGMFRQPEPRPTPAPDCSATPCG
jgi:peptidoglycan glycosyltransferase